MAATNDDEQHVRKQLGVYLGGSRGAAISGEGHARQPLQVSDTGGVTGVYQGQVAALQDCCHALLFAAGILFASPGFISCWP